MHAADPSTMEKLARAQFENNQAEKSIETLNALISANPEYKSTAGHLLFARALEEQGRYEDAVREYKVLRTSYPGEEARVRYAQLLKKMHRPEEATELFRESVLRARRAPKHYQNQQREWLRYAKNL